jgi:hypothetical protein
MTLMVANQSQEGQSSGGDFAIMDETTRKSKVKAASVRTADTATATNNDIAGSHLTIIDGILRSILAAQRQFALKRCRVASSQSGRFGDRSRARASRSRLPFSILKNFFHCSSLCVRHLRRPSHIPRTGHLFTTLQPASRSPCQP